MSGTREAPELRALDLLDPDRPTHWSTVARQLHLRVSSAQQYLSRLARQGMARRVAAGWYVLSRPMRPAWRATPAVNAVVAAAGDVRAAWSTAMFAPFLAEQLPVVVYVAVGRGALAAATEGLTAAGFAVDVDGEVIAGGRVERVLLRGSSERGGVVRGSVIATPTRAFTDLAIEASRDTLEIPDATLTALARALFESQLLSVTQAHRYATRRYAAEAVMPVLREALPDEARRLLRGVLSQ